MKTNHCDPLYNTYANTTISNNQRAPPETSDNAVKTIIGDLNQNGTFDFGDIAGFNALFAGPASAGAQAVPEPTTLSLAVVLLLGLTIRQRRRE